MIKKIIYYFLILVVAILLGLWLKTSPGYVLFACGHWTVEMPFWFFVFVVFFLFVLIHWLIRGFDFLINFSDYMQAWHHRRHFKKAHTVTGKGLLALIEADWRLAEKWLLQGVKKSSIPAINYLGAAIAAQEQNKYEKRNEYIAQAHHHIPEEEVAISLVQAQLQLNHSQLELAQATLKRLQSIAPKHPQVLRLLKIVYCEMKDWQSLSELLPQLRKQKIFEDKILDELSILAYQHLLEREKDLKSLQNLWSRMPKKDKNNEALLIAYCQKALMFNQDEMVIRLISQYLNRKWSDQLVTLFGLAEGEQADKQLAMAENWLKKEKQNANLYLALGRIAARFKHWAKAQEYLNTSLRLRESVENYALLGYIQEQIGNTPKALDYYRKVLMSKRV